MHEPRLGRLRGDAARACRGGARAFSFPMREDGDCAGNTPSHETAAGRAGTHAPCTALPESHQSTHAHNLRLYECNQCANRLLVTYAPKNFYSQYVQSRIVFFAQTPQNGHQLRLDDPLEHYTQAPKSPSDFSTTQPKYQPLPIQQPLPPI